MTEFACHGCMISLSWDDRDPKAAGWYYELRDPDGRVLEHSVMVVAPVTAEAYGEDNRAGIVRALADAYPGAEFLS